MIAIEEIISKVFRIHFAFMEHYLLEKNTPETAECLHSIIELLTKPVNPLHFFTLLLVVAIWGVNFVFVKIGLNELPPFFLCFCRFLPISIPAIFFLKRPPAPFKWVILYALVMFVFQFILMFSGLKAGVTPGLGSLMLQVQVFFSLFFARIVLNEKISHLQIMGGVIAFSGIAVVGWHLDASFSLAGFLLVIGSAMAWGLGSVIVKRMGKVPSGAFLVWASFFAWPPLLVLSLLFEEGASLLCNIHTLSWSAYSAILYISIGATVIGYGLWNHFIQIYPLSRIAPFTFLVPVFGMLSSTIFLGENLESWKIAAGILILSGLFLNLMAAQKPARQQKPS